PSGGLVSAALAAYVARGMSIPEATEHALGYADKAISQGFVAGMGRRIPRRGLSS
ncbi:MAG: hydroxymethylpyrimidine/phosphomethylpyrimidine kinase, partial [Comamonadaceae bacterium]